MKIGIIGTGAIGGTIAKKMVKAGHQVKITNKDEFEKLHKLALELGASASSLKDVVKDVDVVILSVPTLSIPNLPKDLFRETSERLIVVDTSNYYPFRDGKIEELENGKLESEWVSQQIGRPVIKAFNNLLAYTLQHGGKAEGDKERIAMAISGDNQQSKETVSALINDAGFDFVDAGSLSESWMHQPGTPAYCTELSIQELEKALPNAVKEDSAQIRDHSITYLMSLTEQPSHDEIIDYSRSLFSPNPKLN